MSLHEGLVGVLEIRIVVKPGRMISGCQRDEEEIRHIRLAAALLADGLTLNLGIHKDDGL